MFDVANFFSVKIVLAALKLMYLDTYNFFNGILYGHSKKGKNKDS